MKKIKDIFNRIKGKEGNVKKIKIMLVVFGVVLLISAGAYASEVIVFGSERKGAVVAFTEVGEHTWTVPVGVTEIDVLIVGGGGSGASTFQEHKGGGGGAGGLVFRAEYSVIPGEEIIVKVGAGGDAIPDSEATGNRLPGITGEDSSFGDLVALGGGGGRRASSAGAQSGDGGSGGGGHYATAGGNALQPSSSTGGYGNPGGSRASASEGYGGGGAGTPGNNDGDSPADGRVQLGRWAGGQGLYEVVVGGTVYNFASIFGKDYGEYAEGEIWFAGGGGGGRNAAGDSTYGAGGYGGGGRGAYQNQGVSTEWGVGSSKGEDGKPNTGGGGGGARGGESGAGGSGIILIRYQPHLKGASIESGLVGHWRLDEAWYDSSTNRVTDSTPYENHGTNNGATFTTDRKGRDGGAMEFDGSSNYFGMPNDQTLDLTGEFTISVWIKPYSFGGGSNWGLIDRGGYSQYQLKVDTSGRVVSSLWHSGERRDYCYGVGDGAPLNEWSHALITYDGVGTVKSYMNGIPQCSHTRNEGAIDSKVATLNIGRASNYYWDGLMDDVRIYNRALSEDEIKSLYESYNPEITTNLQKGLILHLPLNNKWMKSTTTLTDRTPYGNDAVNHGATINQDNITLDGVNAHLRITDDGFLSEQAFGVTDVFTMSAWAYPRTWANWATIINKANGGCWGNTLNGIWASDQNGFRCTMASGVVDDCNPSGSSIGPSYKPDLNDWYHIVCMADGVNLKMYVNGVYRGQSSIATLTHPRTDNSADVVIGRRTTASGPSFNGDISGIRIYNRAISEEEALLLYERGRNY